MKIQKSINTVNVPTRNLIAWPLFSNPLTVHVEILMWGTPRTHTIEIPGLHGEEAGVVIRDLKEPIDRKGNSFRTGGCTCPPPPPTPVAAFNLYTESSAQNGGGRKPHTSLALVHEDVKNKRAGGRSESNSK